MGYHINQKYKDVMQLVQYHKEVQPTANAMFYYTQPDEVDTLSSRYNTIKEYGSGSKFLMKLK